MTRLGEQTIKLDNPPTITEVASIVGPKEGQGPLAKYFYQCLYQGCGRAKQTSKCGRDKYAGRYSCFCYRSAYQSNKNIKYL